MLIGKARTGLESSARIDPAERESFSWVPHLFRPQTYEIDRPRREIGEREQIQPIVLEDSSERRRVSGPQEMKIA